MEIEIRDIIVGTIGSVLGAIIVYIAGYGFTLTKKQKEKQRQLNAKELNDWRTLKLGIRQGITNNYIFQVLKLLFIASLLGSIGTTLVFMDTSNPSTFMNYRYVLSIIGASSMVLYLIGVGKIMRYLRLRKDDERIIE